MRSVLVTIAVSLALMAGVVAAEEGLPVLTDQNVQKFIEILPEYRAITEKYGEDIKPEETIPTASKLWTEINALLTKHGMTVEEFPLLAQKISMGFAALQMEDAQIEGMGSVFANLPMFKSVTPEEKALLAKYRDQLQTVFEGE